MKRIVLFCCGALSSFLYTQDVQTALYGVKTSFEQEIYKTAQTHEQQQILDALSLADNNNVHDFITFLEENSLQPSIQQALYISAAFHIHARLKAECEFLVKTMYILQLHNQYWQKELIYEQSPLYKKGMHRWGYSFGYIKIVQSHLKNVSGMQDIIALQLGKYLYLLHELKMIQSISDIQKFSELMIQDTFFGLPSSISIAHPAIQSAYAFHEYAQHLEKVCQQACLSTKIPSHIERNKLAYAASLLGVVVVSMIIYKNVDAIKGGAEKAQEAVQNFVTDNVRAPIQKISDVFFNKDIVARPSLVDAKFDLEEDQAFLQGSALKYDVSLEEVIQKHQQSLLHAGDLSSLVNPYNAQKVSDAVSFKATGLILDGKKSLNAAFDALEAPLVEGNIILDQMKLMIPMMALSPAALLAWFGYKATEGLYELLFKRKFITQPFKESLRMIHTLLNEHIHKQEKEYCAEGYLYFYTQILNIIGEKLSMQQQEIFYEDVALLQKYEYSYEQKFNIVQRMYTSYDFLHQ